MQAVAKEKEKRVFPPVAPENLPPSYFVSATYNEKTGKALTKLYETASGQIYFERASRENRERSGLRYLLSSMNSVSKSIP